MANSAEADQVGQRVSRLRRDRDLTQQQLADRSGLTVYRVQQIEAGRGKLLAAQIIALAEAMYLEAKDLMPSLAEDGFK